MAIRPPEPESVEQDIDDTRTEYSLLSSTDSVMRDFMQDLADDLFAAIYNPETDPKHLQRLRGILTDLLQEFAFRIGHEIPSKKGREVMYYVHQNRRFAQSYNVSNIS